MKKKKKFDFAKGKYYITIKSIPNDITIYRKKKQDALDTYEKYVSVGKTVEWHGKWNGKKFEDKAIESAAAAK